ncbi:hypothetical protein ACO0OL_000945 [Hanseniaspora opuntiae]
MAENFYEYEDEESDGFDEWEDIDLNRKEDEEFNFEINNSPLNTKKSKQVALSKLTKKFKQEYINQCTATHSIQAVFSVYNFKTVFLSNYNTDIKLKSIVPGIIRKKFKKLDDSNEKMIVTLIKGFTLWYDKNYQIDVRGERPIHVVDIKNKCYVKWFEQNDNELKEILHEYKPYFNKLKKQYTTSKKMVRNFEPTYMRSDIDVKQQNNNTKQSYVMKFYLLLSALCRNSNIKIKLIYNVPCLDILKAVNDCSTKTFLKIIEEQKYSQETNVSDVKRSTDFDLFYPSLWLEIEVPTGNTFYVNPIVHGSINNYYEKIPNGHPFYRFYEFGKISPYKLETPFYILSVDENLEVQNLSSKYIPNLQYTKRPCLINLKKEIFWLIANYMVLPETSIKTLKNHPNFVVEGFSRTRKNLDALNGTPIAELAINSKKYKVYLRSQLVRVRTTTHWEILGRTVKSGSVPLKTKTYIDRNDEFQKASLYTFDQTCKTPRIPTLNSVKAYRRTLRGNEMLKVFNKSSMLPKEYCLLGDGKISKKTLSKYNKKYRKRYVDYLDVITGFKFLQKNQVKPITQMMVHEADLKKLKEFQAYQDEVEILKSWQELFLRLDIKERLNTQGF